MKAFGYGLNIACDGMVKALWALVKLPSQVSERKRFCLLKARWKDQKILQPAFFSWYGGLPCSINRTNSSAAGEGHQALLLPCLSPRGWLQRDSRKNSPDSDRQEDKLFLHKPYMSLLHKAVHFFCGLWSSEAKCHYQKPNGFYEGFWRQKSLLDSADAEMLIMAEIL